MKAFLIFLIAFFLSIDCKGISNLAEKKSKDSTFKHAEFAGGEDSLLNYIYSHLNYPKYAELAEIEGTVEVEFTIDTIGHISLVEIANSMGSTLDSEAIRVISELPDWTPAFKNGRPIESTYSLPINFKLENNSSKEEISILPENFDCLPYLFAALVSAILITVYMVYIFYSSNRG